MDPSKRKAFANNKPGSSQAPVAKRPRGFEDDDDNEEGFESQLADFEEEPEILEDESQPTADEAECPDTVVTSSKWCRPPAPRIDAKCDALVFQQFDLDYYAGKPVSGLTEKYTHGPLPIVRMFGVTKDGNSVCCHVHGFFPYFFVAAPGGFDPGQIDSFAECLDRAVRNDMRGNKDLTKAVISVEYRLAESIYGFRMNKKSYFLKITMAHPRLLTTTKNLLERMEFHHLEFKDAYESNIDFEIRFMVDTNVVGCCWIELPAGNYRLREQYDLSSRCQIEVDVLWTKFVAHAPDGEWAQNTNFRILSFDIECAGRKGIFPEPEHDSVIQIANMVVRHGEKDPFIRNVFVLNTCGAIVGSQVISCKTEQELLERWAMFVREVDPDFITGYNIQNFDLPYLLGRANALKCTRFPFLGRIKTTKTIIRESRIQSKQMGKRENKVCTTEGRVQFDLLQVLFRDYKLRSYTLNAVSYHFLQEQKEDVHYSIIADLQNGSDQTRRRLAVYCLKDAFLPLRLLDKLMCIVNYIEMARVTGVPLSYLLSRGQQIKIISQLMRKAKEQQLLLPVLHKLEGDEFMGATVLEPEKGYYGEPIATLDFASLYPSIMMAHNLCYTTFIQDNVLRNQLVEGEDYVRTPAGSYFATIKQRKGLLPQILEDLLGARKKAKDDLKKEQDPFKRGVLDGRQLALKISANSVYGFTGAQVGKLPCLDISRSVTAYGRQMIEQTKQEVERYFTKANGYPADAKVIYGDTDSVMVKFGVKTVAEAMKLGREGADHVTKQFVRPIKLEFEKVYCPYLLINKKRYAGLYFTKPDKHDKMDCKGIETVRRDNCPLVGNVLTVVLQKTLIEGNPNGAIEYAKNVISDLLCNRIDISQLIISKELTKSDKDYANKQAHVELAARMRKRDPGSAPHLGDRVPYVIVAASKGTAAYMKAEDPIFVLENNIPIDTQYYLENQLSKPLARIFEPLLGDKVESILLKGEHTLAKTVVHSKVGGLMAFTTKKETCLGCKAVLQNSDATCQHCKKKEADVYLREVASMNVLEQKFNKLWTQCQRCQGSRYEEVICTARDCPIFYMRAKVRKDLQAQMKVVERFGEPCDEEDEGPKLPAANFLWAD